MMSKNNRSKCLQPPEIIVNPTVPKARQSLLKWDGWGYKDSNFEWNTETEDLSFNGGRYMGPGPIRLPYFVDFFLDTLSIEKETAKKWYNEDRIKDPSESSEYPLPASLLTGFAFTNVTSRLDAEDISWSTNGMDRLFRSHGHTLEEIHNLRSGKWGRIPDIVIWVSKTGNAQSVVSLAKEFNLVVIPYGGGTTVSAALICDETELRPIISLDTSQMCNILHLDEENMTCIAGAGITGKDIESVLKVRGYTLGHEPDSYEFSTLGGWVATRASGMKKNNYGNIEDIVLGAKMVTPTGVVESFTGSCPRISAGPSVTGFVLGSEGCLGVITEVHVKFRCLPKSKQFGSIVFPNFDVGVSCLTEIAKERCQPSSIRLLDNEQFHFGAAIRTELSYFDSWKESIKLAYLTKWKGLDLNEISVATLLFEGNEDAISTQEAKIYSIAAKYGGIAGGGRNGERGYNLTFVIAYIRDLGLDIRVLGESHETSVPWSKTKDLCRNTKLRVEEECRERGLECFVSCRVTQTYDSGCCVYFYLGVKIEDSQDPVRTFNSLEETMRREIIRNGGSISHHHGVGKMRKQWMRETHSVPALRAIQSIKSALDPTNIFAAKNNVFGLELEVTGLSDTDGLPEKSSQ